MRPGKFKFCACACDLAGVQRLAADAAAVAKESAAAGIIAAC